MPMSASFWCAFAGRPARIVLGFVLVLLAAACGGGGGGGGSIGGGSTGGGSSFNTAEFQANFGLGNINVLSAYDAGFSGQGQTVAVIDTGIDVDHPDLDANIAAASTDIVTGNPIFVDDDDGHGTSVAGVIAAERNGIGMHGVAFNSEILAIRTDTIGSCFTICAFEDDDIAAAVDFAVANGAGVINISLGGAVPSNATLRTALQNATAAGVIVVVAAGNDGGANPISPALLAADATFNGLIIAAGAVDSTNAIASFSNLAGTTQNFYLVAPGVNIFTTTIGGGFTTVSGTSFSAPHIAGGFALILERFPALTAAQVVQLLLDTATDLGAAGTDAVFGQGLLNLSAALAPLGTLSVPLGTTTGSGASGLGSTTMSLGSAFGDALTDAPVLAKAIVLDELGRAYLANLALGVGPADETLDLANLLVSEGEINSGTIDISTGSRLRLAFVERPAPIPGNAAAGPDAPAAFTEIEDLEFDFSAALSDQTRLSLGFGKPLINLGTLDWMGAAGLFHRQRRLSFAALGHGKRRRIFGLATPVERQGEIYLRVEWDRA